MARPRGAGAVAAAAGPAVLLLLLAAPARAAQMQAPFLSCADDFPVRATVDWQGPRRPAPTWKGAPDDSKYWVFIIGAPRGGTSAAYGLLSTSNSSSNLCKGRWGLCEGTWDVIEAGRLPLVDEHGKRGTQWQAQKYPLNWNDIVDNVYSKRWNMSKAVLLEKSPPNTARVAEIYKSLKGRKDRKVRFIVVTQSPCLYASGEWSFAMRQLMTWRGCMSNVVTSLKGIPQEYWLHVKMEDLFRDPYGESQRMLNFIPALGSLDPESTGLKPRVEKNPGKKSTRLSGIMGYIRSRGGMLHNRTQQIATNAYRWLIKTLGYNRYLQPARLLIPGTPQERAYARAEAAALAKTRSTSGRPQSQS